MTWPMPIGGRLAAEYPTDAEAARDLVMQSLGGREPVDADQRLVFAVLDLAHGDLSLLGHYAVRAREDFRDVLFWAETQPEPDEPRTYEELLARLRRAPGQT